MRLSNVAWSIMVCAALSLPAAHEAAATETRDPSAAAGWNPAAIPGMETLVDAAARQVKRTGDATRIAAFEDVRDVMAHASEWRWYARDNGILLAIPIRERLGIPAKAEGERALEDVVRRLINQAGWGNPPVQVILVGREEPCHVIPPCPPCEPATAAAPCGCE